MQNIIRYRPSTSSWGVGLSRSLGVISRSGRDIGGLLQATAAPRALLVSCPSSSLGFFCLHWGACIITAGAPLGVTFAAVFTIVCIKRWHLTVIWSASSSGGSDDASWKEGRRAAYSHVRNVAILSSHRSFSACGVSSVYADGGGS